MSRFGLIACLALVAAAAAPPRTELPERFAMRAKMKDNNRPVRVEITIERWTDGADHDRLFDILAGGDPGTFKPTLATLPEVGQMRVDAYRSYALRYAREGIAEDGTRLVRIATDLPIGFQSGEGYFRTSQAAFTLMELAIDANGEGSGAAEVGEQLRLHPEIRAFGLPDADAASVRLSGIRATNGR